MTHDVAAMLTTIVHEGRHCLDIFEGRIPEENPGGPECLLAEMLAWADAAEFAAENGDLDTDAARLASCDARDLAINLERSYRNSIGRMLSDDEMMDVIERFKRCRDG